MYSCIARKTCCELRNHVSKNVRATFEHENFFLNFIYLFKTNLSFFYAIRISTEWTLLTSRTKSNHETRDSPPQTKQTKNKQKIQTKHKPNKPTRQTTKRKLHEPLDGEAEESSRRALARRPAVGRTQPLSSSWKWERRKKRKRKGEESSSLFEPFESRRRVPVSPRQPRRVPLAANPARTGPLPRDGRPPKVQHEITYKNTATASPVSASRQRWAPPTHTLPRACTVTKMSGRGGDGGEDPDPPKGPPGGGGPTINGSIEAMLTPELLFRMNKKIAQLTKVSPSLNSLNSYSYEQLQLCMYVCIVMAYYVCAL